LFFTHLQLVENPNVENVSGIFWGFALILIKTDKLTSTLNDSFNSLVSIESQKGKKLLVSSPNALIHFPSVLRLRFIEFISFNAYPITFDHLTLSDPAKSTNWSFVVVMNWSWPDQYCLTGRSSIKVNTEWDQDDLSFIIVEEITHVWVPYKIN